jgi:transposase
MPTRFVNIDRNTPLLLQPDLRDWVDEDDLVHFVLEAVGSMKITNFNVNLRGTGSRQYPPKTMLALLIYCYANGIFSSRRIERATYRDIAVRYLMANTHPDHDTIAKFRRENFDAISHAFVEVLMLAKELQLLKVGTVSIDGTHIKANASKDRNVRYDRACELETQLELDVQELLDKAEQADENDDDGQSLPKELARREVLRAKMQQAREQIEHRHKQQWEKDQKAYENRMKEREAKPCGGQPPRPPAKKPDDKKQINMTDADSQLMRKTKRSPCVQAYNAQAAVEVDSMLIVSQHVTTNASDRNELIPALNNIPESVGKPEYVLADTGYSKAETFAALEDEYELLIAVNSRYSHEQRQYDWRPTEHLNKLAASARPIKDPHLVKMQKKLDSDEGKAKYRLRQQTVEPVFGIIKSVMGFRQFLMRGVEKVAGEWTLASLAYNVKRLHKLKLA